jgi:hypothetical protein
LVSDGTTSSVRNTEYCNAGGLARPQFLSNNRQIMASRAARSHVLIETMITESHHAREKQTFLFGGVIAWIRRNELKAKLHSAFATHVPVGYEDETGFHFERKPAPVRSDPDSLSEFGQF